MSIIVIEIDLAKSIFAVHGVNQAGKAELVNPGSAGNSYCSAIHFGSGIFSSSALMNCGGN